MTVRAVIVLVVSALLCSGAWSSSSCRRPPPADGFTNAKYSGGPWFEIGKIQTFGGAFFEKNCVCTQLEFSETNPANGDGQVVNACRDQSPTGAWTNATGLLFNEAPVGSWQEKMQGYETSTANYTIISLGEDYAVEYDCTSSLGLTNYCIHVLSRTRTMDPALFNKLIQQAEALDLNPEKLEVKMTKQEGCV